VSSLKAVEKRYFEDLFNMSSGYVLEFTNATYAEFFRECVRLNIYDNKYSFNGDSKAKRLRAFWEIEPDNIVGKALLGLLEIWEYENSGKEDQKCEKCKQIAERLLGKKKETSEDDFLSKDFGDISIRKLKVEQSLLPILESRLKEAYLCMQIKASLAVIFLCGSILEGMLLGVAQQNIEKFNRSKSSPKDNNGKVKNLPDWTLNDFINVAYSEGFLGLDIKKFSHSLREFRNYIHPYQQMVSGFNPDEHTAKICLQVLKAAIVDLNK